MSSTAHNPNDFNGDELVAVAAVFLGLTISAVLLRFSVRIFLTKSFSADDWLMAISQGVFACSCSFIFAGVHWGIGRHNKSISEKREVEALKYQALATISYVANMMFIKLSIGIFLLRLAVQKRYIWILRISMSIIFIWSTVIIFWLIFQCQPVAFQWDYTIVGGKCPPGDDFVAAALSVSVMTVVSDWLYAIMPIFMIWSVKMSLRKRITVAFVLSLGVFASVATLIRLKYLAELADYSDQLFTGTDAMIWTLIEPGIAIIAASLVTIRPLLHAMHIGGFGSKNGTSGAYGRSGYGMGRSNPLSIRGGPEPEGWAATSFQTSKASGGLSRNESSAERYKSNSKVHQSPVSDAGSEEYILEGIRRTVDVTVSRDRESNAGEVRVEIRR